LKICLGISGVAADAGPVPAVEWSGPVVGRAGFCGLARAEPEPFLLDGVPGDVESLQPAAAYIDEVLLQRLVGEGVSDLEFALLAVGPLGPDEELFSPPEERRRYSVGLEAGVVEIRPHRTVVRDGHRPGMVRFGEGGG